MSKTRRGPVRARNLTNITPMRASGGMVMSVRLGQGMLHIVIGRGDLGDTSYLVTKCDMALSRADSTTDARDLDRQPCCPRCGTREDFEAVQAAHRALIAERTAEDQAARLAREAETYERLQAQLLRAEGDLADAGLRDAHIERGETAIHIVVNGRRYRVLPEQDTPAATAQEG